MSAENPTGAPAPSPANAYASPFREAGERRGAAGEVVHWVLLCACTADCPLGAPLPTSCWHPCSLSCSLRPHPRPGPSLPSPVQTGTGFSLQSRRASPASSGSCLQNVGPGMLGEEGMGDLGRKPGRSNDTSTFFKKASAVYRHMCMTSLKLFLKVMTRY